MLILALDTTTRAASVALAREDRVLEEAACDVSQPTAARLPADLIALLDRQRFDLAAVDAFAVATGPGSFTGMRIGIATMQGLAFANRKPLVGISGFDALAAIPPSAPDSSGFSDYGETGTAAAGAGYVATWVDAWRGEVYAALYDGPCVIEPTVDLPDSVLTAIETYMAGSSTPHVTFIGDGAVLYRDAIVQRLGARASIAEPGTPLLAGAVARLAARTIARGEQPLPHAIRPLYVRRPDVELARSRARGLSQPRPGQPGPSQPPPAQKP